MPSVRFYFLTFNVCIEHEERWYQTMCERWFEEVGDASFTPAINEYDPVKKSKQHFYIEGLAKYLEKQALAQ